MSAHKALRARYLRKEVRKNSIKMSVLDLLSDYFPCFFFFFGITLLLLSCVQVLYGHSSSICCFVLKLCINDDSYKMAFSSFWVKKKLICGFYLEIVSVTRNRFYISLILIYSLIPYIVLLAVYFGGGTM